MAVVDSVGNQLMSSRFEIHHNVRVAGKGDDVQRPNLAMEALGPRHRRGWVTNEGPVASGLLGTDLGATHTTAVRLQRGGLDEGLLLGTVKDGGTPC